MHDPLHSLKFRPKNKSDALTSKPAKTLGRLFFLAFLISLALIDASSASAYLRSEYLGGWPGLCEGQHCYDDGTPLSEPPPDSQRRILEHQLVSPTCVTDLVYITIDYPENTGSFALDQRLEAAMKKKFAAFKAKSMELTCNDFDGCQGRCLPVGFEIKNYVHQSSEKYLSIFQVERFIGNIRRNRQIRATVTYSFANYDLTTGAPLTLKDIFPNANQSVPKFWSKVDELLKAADNCPAKRLLISGRKITGVHLTPTDLILTRGGATIALTTPKAGTCRPQALDIDVKTMIELGARPALWGR
ncbi:MAG: hypothetical protein LBE31_00995 [Deltaproteobacteria bacterium]|jgi:hypothetical protein|nr:hypothetical protein [Deltaproteobacteria bacterium]